MRHIGRHRAHRFHAGQWLADDAAEKRRCRTVRLARTHCHRHQPGRATVDVTLARVVGQQVLADQLLRAIGRLGRRQRGVADQRGQRHGRVRPEHRDRTGEHQSRRRAACSHVGAQRIEQRTRAVEVGAQAKIEIGLALARHRRREMKHPVERLFPQRVRLRHQVTGARLDACICQQIGRRWCDIGQHQSGDRLACQGAALQQGAGKTGADESAAASDQKFHEDVLSELVVMTFLPRRIGSDSGAPCFRGDITPPVTRRCAPLER